MNCVYRRKSGAGSFDGGTSRRADGDRLLESRATGWRRLRQRRPQPLPLRGDGGGRRNRRRSHSKLSIFSNRKEKSSWFSKWRKHL